MDMFANASRTFSYSHTPFGPILSHCVHEVPSGAHVTQMADGQIRVLAPDGTLRMIPECDTQGGAWPMRQALPPNYDGWLQYTELNASDLGLKGGFDSFTSVMSVPDTPKQEAQILYFFPGLQNIDWIPKVDPEPTRATPFDIIQPVLQYPAGSFERSWALKSWYVTVNAGALYSEAISNIQPGDEIFCNMTRTGAQSWRVSGALRSDPGKETVQQATNPRLALQPWAYSAVAECYGCRGCDTYPTKPIVFSENRLYQGGKLLDVPGSLWKRNPKPALKLMCNEATEVAANGDATISFV
mmetsp:Transcript_8858/g.19762  ORF Transcript_8858/g.19762 Transcript_8858/m.19762 type:complete len:299 (-) Transcript_8858:329-1225(-)